MSSELATQSTNIEENQDSYWVSRNGEQPFGPYSAQELRSRVEGYWRVDASGQPRNPDYRSLGFVLITDQAKNATMTEWNRVDRILAAMPGDNTSDYWVTRGGGPLSGPYNLVRLADWAKNGRILLSDQAKNIAMHDWGTVGAIIQSAGINLAAHRLSTFHSEPQRPMNEPYWLFRTGQTYGPYPLHVLSAWAQEKSGKVQRGDMLRCASMEKWLPVTDVLEVGS